jgi:protein-S-isoprenylcysteine O-methyltransferase Ste14
MKEFFKSGMLSLFLRNLLFTVLQPGLVTVLFPYLILIRESPQLFDGHFGLIQFLGLFLFLIGAAVLFDCIIRFAMEGEGTLSPVDRTKKLVISGLYKYSRNPMYWGVMMILIGEALFFESGGLWIYLLFIFIAFTVFILLVEEPRLKKDFGEHYEEYRKKVRRWI